MNRSDLALRLTCISGKYYFCKSVPNVMTALNVCSSMWYGLVENCLGISSTVYFHKDR